MESILHDLRFAARSMRKRPGFSASAVLTLALGLGLNTALFTALNAYVLRPLAVRDPYSLYQVGVVAKGHVRTGMTWREFETFRSRADVFDEVLAERDVFANLAGEVSRGLLISGNYFSMLGGTTLIGRPIQGADQEPVIVLGHGFWRSRFGSDREIVGKLVAVGRQSFIVTGVAAPGFTGLSDPDFWIPIARRREIGVRLSLGASRRRIVQQLVTEGLVLRRISCWAP